MGSAAKYHAALDLTIVAPAAILGQHASIKTEDPVALTVTHHLLNFNRRYRTLYRQRIFQPARRYCRCPEARGRLWPASVAAKQRRQMPLRRHTERRHSLGSRSPSVGYPYSDHNTVIVTADYFYPQISFRRDWATLSVVCESSLTKRAKGRFAYDTMCSLQRPSAGTNPGCKQFPLS